MDKINNINIGRLTIGHDTDRDAVTFTLDSLRRPFHDQYGLCIMWCHRHGGDQYSNASTRQWLQKRYFTNFYNISHLIVGHGWLYLENSARRDFNAGDGVIMLPRVIHDYSAYDTYCEDCLAFAGPIADHLAACGIIKPEILHIGKMRRLLPIIELAADPGKNSQIKANLQLQNLLTELYFENLDSDQKFRCLSFDKLLHIVRKRPEKWWTVGELAELAGLSVNHFIREFRNYSGATPKNYIDTMKINLAAEDLRRFDKPIAAIARDYGYKDVYHFSRRFKKIVGISPGFYRKSFISE